MNFRGEVIALLQKATKLKKQEIDAILEIPPDLKLGDLSFPCFKLAKTSKKPSKSKDLRGPENAKHFLGNPAEIAKELASNLKSTGPIKEVKTLGPYLNFFADEYRLSLETLRQIFKEKDKFGSKNKLHKVAVIEHTGPNTNKPLHIGHIRNMCLGESYARILENEGWSVKRVNIINDRGIHISKSMLAYQKWGRGKSPGKNPDRFVGDFYVKYSQKLKESPILEKEAQDLLKKWEEKDTKTMALWRKMNSWTLKGHAQTYKEFGINFDKQYYESNTYEKGKQIILDGLKKGIFHRKPDGAVYIDLGEKLGEKILLRADGTSVYVTQDVYLAKIRDKDYHFDKLIYVVASEQNYHFDVLFKLLKMLKYPFADKCYHLSYGMVFLPEGKMKSREGTVVDAVDVLNEMESLAKKEIIKRQKLSKTKLSKLARKIALSAIKYHMLKFNAVKDFTFDPKESISFEGDTGPYLQYSLVRAKKIIKKSKTKPTTKINFKLLDKPVEIKLIKQLIKFPEIVEKAYENFSPHVIANYASELASSFNSFYEKYSVIKAEKKLKEARVLLVFSFAQVLKNCLHLLGIEEVDLM